MVGAATRSRPRALLLGVALAAALAPAPAAGWGVGSAFSESCHERLSAQAFLDTVVEISTERLPVPEGATWRKVARYVIDFVPEDVGDLTDGQRFLLHSLIVGARSPDTEGHSILNLDTLRQYHSDPDPRGQYAHALRSFGDDGELGEQRTVEGTRDVIEELVLRAEEFGTRRPEEQVILVPFYMDYYGRIEVEVWGPFYYYGRAVHAVQDSFSHTIRDEAGGFRSIVHVMNYLDAIAGHLDEDRDGLAHSDHRDDCTEDDNADVVDAATEATIDFFYAVRARAYGADPNALGSFFDKWMQWREGCTFDNEFCRNARLLSASRKGATGPYVEAMLGCEASGARTGAGPGVVPLVGLLLTLLGIGWLRRAAR